MSQKSAIQAVAKEMTSLVEFYDMQFKQYIAENMEQILVASDVQEVVDNFDTSLMLKKAQRIVKLGMEEFFGKMVGDLGDKRANHIANANMLICEVAHEMWLGETNIVDTIDNIRNIQRSTVVN